VAGESGQRWYKSIPGILTTATGLIAAVSGLVAGLNQLGVFRREPPPAAVVGMTPAVPDKTAQDSLTSSAPLAPDSAAIRPASPPAAATRPPTPSAAPPKPTASPRPAAPAPASDTVNAGSVRVPWGTALSLTVPARTCAPADGSRRFAARLAAPVRVNGATVLPAGTTAVLRLRRVGAPAAPRVRLDSLVRSGVAVSVSSSQVQIPAGSASGACLRAGARLTAVLGEAVTLPRS
jgi:hypothetical protein